MASDEPMSAHDPTRDTEATAGDRASCGCTIGGLHRYACAGVGHVDPPPTAAASKRRIGECDRHDDEDRGLQSSARCTCAPTAAASTTPEQVRLSEAEAYADSVICYRTTTPRAFRHQIKTAFLAGIDAARAQADAEPECWACAGLKCSAHRGAQSDMPADPAPEGGLREGIKERLTKALHDERVEKGTQHADCWACEVMSSVAIYAEVWDSYHLGRQQALADLRAQIDRLPAPCTRPDVLALLDVIAAHPAPVETQCSCGADATSLDPEHVVVHQQDGPCYIAPVETPEQGGGAG